MKFLLLDASHAVGCITPAYRLLASATVRQLFELQ